MIEIIIGAIVGFAGSLLSAFFWGKNKYNKGYTQGRVDQVEEIKGESRRVKALIDEHDDLSDALMVEEHKNIAREYRELTGRNPTPEEVEAMIKESTQ